MKRLLFIAGSFYPAQEGGVDNTLFWIAKALASKGVDVTVVTTKKGISDEMKKKSNIRYNVPSY